MPRRPRLFTGFVLAAPLILTGCVASISPIVPADEAEFDPALVGTWQPDDSRESAVITAAAAGEYLIVYTDEEGETGRFRARLGRLGPHRVLDLEPEQDGVQASDVYKGLLLPLHTALFIESIGDQVRFRGLEIDSLTAYLERDPAAAAHVLIDGTPMLTAETPALREFLLGFARRPGVFAESALWRRR